MIYARLIIYPPSKADKNILLTDKRWWDIFFTSVNSSYLVIGLTIGTVNAAISSCLFIIRCHERR